MVNISDHDDLQLPSLPKINHDNNLHDSGILKLDQFGRKNLKNILHIITQELKKKGTKTPHILLPFRSKIKDSNLNQFLNSIAPNGEIIKDLKLIQKLCLETDEFTLICCLKYFWSRLPNNEIIGYNVYLEFKRKEKEQNYPKNAFLTIMPKCLSSPAHASIVYDFLDLILNIISNSQYNYLSGRKISKMASLWAFRNTNNKDEIDFIEGIENWNKITIALFHLVLSFLRSMLPESDSETLKLPKTLQSLLITNQYPPEIEKENMRSSITIPCVYVTSSKPSKNVYDLISKVRHSLSFDQKDNFSKENYTILKNVFAKKSTSEIVDTFTEESKRIIDRLTVQPDENKFNLRPGWASSIQKEDVPLVSNIVIKDISIQDYFIWTWLSSLASDQPFQIKKAFGRSIVVEADVLGFQKWIVITEKLMDPKLVKKELKELNKSKRSAPLPPLPVENKKNKEFLPPIPTDDDPDVLPPDLVEVYENFERSFGDETSYIYPTSVHTDELKEEIPAEITSRFTKVTVGDMYATNNKGLPNRKAPPEIQSIPVEEQSTPQQDQPYFEVFDPNFDSPMTINQDDLGKQEEDTHLDKKNKKKELKLRKQAEAAQLAAAQAAGFATIPSNLPPLNFNDNLPPIQQTVKSMLLPEEQIQSSNPSESKCQNSSRKTSPQKYRRTPIDESKPLPNPNDTNSEIDVVPTVATLKPPKLEPPPLTNSPSIGFISSPNPQTHIHNTASPQLLSQYGAKYDDFVSHDYTPSKSTSPVKDHVFHSQSPSAIDSSTTLKDSSGQKSYTSSLTSNGGSESNKFTSRNNHLEKHKIQESQQYGHQNLQSHSVSPPQQGTNIHQIPHPQRLSPDQTLNHQPIPQTSTQSYVQQPQQFTHQQTKSQQTLPNQIIDNHQKTNLQRLSPNQQIPTQIIPPQHTITQPTLPIPQQPMYQQHVPYMYQPQMYPQPPQQMYNQPPQPQMYPPQMYQIPPQMYQPPPNQPYPPQMYQHPHPHPQMYPHPQLHHQPPPQNSTLISKPQNISNNAMIGMIPMGAKHNKNKATNKVNLRHDLLQGDFGI
ncbi:MSB1 [Candida jiufengensis]|uniref:MSB1 n=1 Tax=Candida jiufengensis TaxID=497108 RepID=UPI0022245CB6|nr:MSB1 [Candida jiufengensis]KAI5955596.1 MSB1 [Candida jiufengensis]